jgi:Family of unknown function (DUF6260)
VFTQDFVLNGVGYGPVAEMLANVRFDPGLLRPYVDERNRRACTVNTGRTAYNEERKQYEPVFEQVLQKDLIANGIDSPVFNATALRKEEWLQLDQVVLRAARYRLRAWADLAAENSFGGFNGMAKLILEHETMSDPGEAMVDMDGITDDRTDNPQFQLQGLPLPITHAGFFFSSRRLAVSRNSGTPLDTTMGEACGRRVAEAIEKTTIGVQAGITYGGASTLQGGYSRNSTVYGYTNFTPRLVKTNLTTPTGSNASATLNDVLSMRDQLYANKFYGPFMLYHSNDWDKFMDNDYILTGGNVATQTLRERLKAIEGIMDVRRLDFLFSTPPSTNTASSTYTGPGGEGVRSIGYPFTLLLVQMTPDTARAVNGMDITTIQWESHGGLRLNFRVMAIQVPQLRADFYNNCGILEAVATGETP